MGFSVKRPIMDSPDSIDQISGYRYAKKAKLSDLFSLDSTTSVEMGRKSNGNTQNETKNLVFSDREDRPKKVKVEVFRSSVNTPVPTTFAEAAALASLRAKGRLFGSTSKALLRKDHELSPKNLLEHGGFSAVNSDSR